MTPEANARAFCFATLVGLEVLLRCVPGCALRSHK